MASWSGLPLPSIWSVPAQRNLNFWGRQRLLERLHDALASGKPPRGAQALVGLCGIGKTQIALEYAYRYAKDYTLIWWVRAAKQANRREDYARLAQVLGLPQKDVKETVVVTEAVRRYLEQHQRWLLIFDDASSPVDLAPYLPRDNAGHILVTSRNPDWAPVAWSFPVATFGRREAADYLLKRARSRGQLTLQQKAEEEKAAINLAEALSDLPLALEQVSVYVETTHKSLAEYLDLFRAGKPSLLDRFGPPEKGGTSLGAVFEDALQQAQAASPAAIDLIKLCAFLAPRVISSRRLWQWIHVARQPTSLVEQPTFNDALMALRYAGLIHMRMVGDALSGVLSVDRLTQTILRSRLTDQDRAQWIEIALGVVSAALPDDSYALEKWPMDRRVLEHARVVMGHARKARMTPDVFSKLYNQVGLYLRARGRYGEAKAALGHALALDKRTHGLKHPHTARDASNLAGVLCVLGNPEGARRLYKIALHAVPRPWLLNPIAAILANNIGCVLQEMGDLSGANAHYCRALSIERWSYRHSRWRAIARLLQPKRARRVAQEWYRSARTKYRADLAVQRRDQPRQRSVGKRQSNLGRAWDAIVSWWSGARVRFEHTVVDQMIQDGGRHLKVANRYNNLGSAMKSRTDMRKAESWLGHAVEMAKVGYGPESHPAVASALNNQGSVWQALGKLSEARKCFADALRIDEQVYGRFHPTVANDCNNLADVLLKLGDPVAAHTQIQRALSIDSKVFHPNHPILAMDHNKEGDILEAEGDLSGARAQFETALGVIRKPTKQQAAAIATIPNPPKRQAAAPVRVTTLSDLGYVQFRLGDYREALDNLGEALYRAQAIYGPDDAIVANLHANVGTVYLQLGRTCHAAAQYQDAVDYHRRAMPHFIHVLWINLRTRNTDLNQIASDFNNLGCALLGIGSRKRAWLCFPLALWFANMARVRKQYLIDVIKKNIP